MDRVHNQRIKGNLHYGTQSKAIGLLCAAIYKKNEFGPKMTELWAKIA